MTVSEILTQVRCEFRNCDPWKVSHIESKKRILELFKENNIPETEYKP